MPGCRGPPRQRADGPKPGGVQPEQRTLLQSAPALTPGTDKLALCVGQKLEHASPRAWKWRGRSITLLDGTTISMPDTEQNQSAYPQSGVQKPGLGFPLAMLVALISLSTGAVRNWALGPCRGKHTGEQALFRTLMTDLSPGDIVLADRYYCNYFTAALL